MLSINPTNALAARCIKPLLLGATSLCLSLVGGVGPAAHAQSHDHAGDIEVFTEGNRLRLNTDFAEAEFASVSPGVAPYQFDEPGFLAEAEPPLLEPPLPDGAFFGFDVGLVEFAGASRSVWHWDGGDGVTPPTAADFTASPHGLQISHPGTAQSVRVDGAAGATGFWFALAEVAPGEAQAFDEHLLFTLVDGAGAAVLNPAAGVYVFKTTHRAEDDGASLEGNPPLYWVAGLDVAEEAHELAAEFVIQQFALSVPEPNSLGIMAMGLALACLSRVARPDVRQRRG